MTRCWTCGAEQGLFFKCSACTQTKKIVETLEVSNISSVKNFDKFSTTELSGSISEMSDAVLNLASVIEWSFDELNWKIEQATEILRSIDKTLKMPSQVQANEWRGIAEELRRREILEESKTFFLKSLKTNPLDYRTYIGLGKTYLQLECFDEAKDMWEKSLPHAPKTSEGNIINYKSYSYRLIGRMLFCQENYQEAVSVLKKAIELSPKYYLGYYDHAQYCALIKDKENCFSSLSTALSGPISFELVRNEINFNVFKEEIGSVLGSMANLKTIRNQDTDSLTKKLELLLFDLSLRNKAYEILERETLLTISEEKEDGQIIIKRLLMIIGEIVECAKRTISIIEKVWKRPIGTIRGNGKVIFESNPSRPYDFVPRSYKKYEELYYRQIIPLAKLVKTHSVWMLKNFNVINNILKKEGMGMEDTQVIKEELNKFFGLIF